MSKLDKLEEVMDEVEAGLTKLDKGDIWSVNSHPLSLFIVSMFLFHLAIAGILIDVYYALKFKIYWRLLRK